MKILIKVICLCCISGLIGISHAQHTVGENAILYVGSRHEDGTQPVYILDIEHLAERIQIGTVNQHGSATGWSPDGRYVFIVNYDADDNRTLTLYDVEADTAEVMTDRLYDNECYAPVFWSPDGRYMAFQESVDEQFVTSLWDSVEDTISTIEGVRAESIYYDVWSPDGRYLALPDANSTDYGGTFIWDTVTQNTITTFNSDTYLNQEFLWSPDERYFVYSENSEVIIYNPTNATQVTVTGNEIGAISPDGRYTVYFQRDGSYGEAASMYLYDTREQQEILVSDIALVYNTHWSPDSHSIAFIRWQENHEQGLSLYDVPTGETANLLSFVPVIAYVRWSASSEYIAVVYSADGRKEDGFSLAIYRRGQGLIQRFEYTIPNIYYAFPIHWSPMGDYLVLMTAESGDVLFDAAANREVAFSNWTERNPYIIRAWSADGQHLVFGGHDGSNSRIYVYDFATNDATVLPLDSDWSFFIGWRGTNKNASLIHCGEG